MDANRNPNLLVYHGANYLRQRLILATLSGHGLLIKQIRHRHSHPGINEYEASLLRLLDALANGTRIEINESGTELLYQPGMIVGGTVSHACNMRRGISYYLEPLLCLAAFSKLPFDVTLTGITNNGTDLSVDCLKTSSLPLLHRFLGTEEGLELKIERRGLLPKGGGLVRFRCPMRPKLLAVQLLKPGRVVKIRGVAYACRVSPMMANRVGQACKSVLKEFLTDVHVSTDHCKGVQGGESPGFGITLTAHTDAGNMLSIDVASTPRRLDDMDDGAADEPAHQPTVPDELGELAALQLLEEIRRVGAADSANQSMALILMACGPQDVSEIVLGPLTPHTMKCLQHIRDFLNVVFTIEDFDKTSKTAMKPNQQQADESDSRISTESAGRKFILKCMGAGMSNLAKITR